MFYLNIKKKKPTAVILMSSTKWPGHQNSGAVHALTCALRGLGPACQIVPGVLEVAAREEPSTDKCHVQNAKARDCQLHPDCNHSGYLLLSDATVEPAEVKLLVELPAAVHKSNLFCRLGLCFTPLSHLI